MAAAVIVGWAWFWALVSDLGFSDLAYDRGRSGLWTLAIGIAGAVLGSRSIKTSTRARWLVLLVALTLPVYVFVHWLVSVNATP